MNMYEWMKAEDSEAPLHEDNSREDPSHRPQLPESDAPPVEDHVIPDPEMPTDISVSNESIIADIRKFFGKDNRGPDYMEVDGNKKATGHQLMVSLEKTYCNEQWLAKQTHKPGKIKVGDLADRINLDKIEQSVQETGAINTQFQNAQIEAIITNIKSLKEVLENIDPRTPTDEDYDKLKAILPDIKSSPSLMKVPQRRTTNLIGGKETDEVREALTVDEAVAVAQAVLKELQSSQQIWLDGAKAVDGAIPAFTELYNGSFNKVKSESYNTDTWNELMTAIHRKVFTGSPDTMAVYRQFESACIAAITYVERSFAGTKAERIEEVSNEGIVDDIRKLFDANKDKDALKKADAGFLHGLEKELKNYANPGWVKRRGIVEGDVSVSALNLLGQAGDKVVSDFVAKMKTARTSKEKVLPGVIDGVEDIIKQLESGAGTDASKAKAIIAKVNELRKYSIEELPWHKEKGRTGSTKALTELEVNQLAKQLADVFAAAKPVSGVADEFRAVTKGEGTAWYRNWKFVEGKSHSKLYDQLKSAGVNPDSFFGPWEKLMEALADDVQMGGELARIKSYLMVRFELIEKSVK